jgi:hypothetical protein
MSCCFDKYWCFIRWSSNKNKQKLYVAKTLVFLHNHAQHVSCTAVIKQHIITKVCTKESGIILSEASLPLGISFYSVQ